MSVQIGSGATADLLTVDPTSKAARVTRYDAAGNLVESVRSLANVLNALNSAATVSMGGQGTFSFNVTGTTGSLTLSFEATIDGTNWFSITGTPVAGGTAVSSTTADGQWLASTAGYNSVRARISAFTSGSMTVSLVGTPSDSKNINQAVSFASLPLPTGASTSANQTTLGAQTTKINDGTNTVAVKPASTSPLATDPALVVTLSPNSPSSNPSVGTNGSATPSSSNLAGASDGVNLQPLQVESSSNKNLRTAIYDGANKATVTGANALKVDGSAVTQPVSGTVTANAGTGTFTNQQSNVQTDYDTGAGTQNLTMFGMALPASGGAVAGGTATNPLRVDPTGTTNQPVSGTVTANAGTGNFGVNLTQVGSNTVVTGGTNGSVGVGGLAADGAAVSGNPVLIGGSDGTNARIVDVQNVHPASNDYGVMTRTIPAQLPTFRAHYDRIAPAANKYMATLFNTSSTRKVVIQRVIGWQSSVTAVTGVVLDQEVRRITARTAGTTVTPSAHDSNDSLSAGITADTNSTAVTDGNLEKRFVASSEEVALTSRADQYESGEVIYERKDGTKGITLRQNQGFSIKNITASTVGVYSYIIEFTDEAA